MAWAEASSVLLNPLSPRRALAVPVGGRRPVAPRLRWGAVAVDASVYQWTARRAQLLGYAVTLVKSGIGPTLLGEALPPMNTTLDMEEKHHLWQALDPVRADRGFVALLGRLSAATKNDTGT